MKKNKFLEKEIHNSFYEHRKLLDSIYSKKFSKKIINISNIIAKSLKSGGMIFWCGNGGSASDSQHLSAELIGRLKKNRKPLRSISLSSNIAGITCISNDFGYHKLFSRQLEGLGKKNDVIVCITTSGKSKNIIEVLKMARRKKIKSIGFLGGNGGAAIKQANTSLLIPSKNTARIQEMHIFLGQLICSNVEKILKL
jgi:D-sedoheptulose 7-phosphate isomerase